MPSAPTLRIGLCGLGTVGSQVLQLLLEHHQRYQTCYGVDLQLTGLSSRSDRYLDRCTPPAHVPVVGDPLTVARAEDVDVVVELIGGLDTARELVMTSIRQGKHVITANKALLAEHGKEIFQLAGKHGVNLGFDAAVGGGIPLLGTLQQGLAANKVNYLAGIINGTSNFILSGMDSTSADGGKDFQQMLEEAQSLGYAEADPSSDVEGYDAAQKLAILAALTMDTGFAVDKVRCSGIAGISKKDFSYAQELGYNIKPLAVAQRMSKSDNEVVDLRVHPALVPTTSMLGKVNGVMNAVMLDSDIVGHTLLYGAGAGGKATASAVLGDLLGLARGWQLFPVPLVPQPTTGASKDDVHHACYIRLSVEDKPGALAAITRSFETQKISLESVIQKAPSATTLHHGDYVDLILLTESVAIANLERALTEVLQLSFIATDGLEFEAGEEKFLQLPYFGDKCCALFVETLPVSG